MDLFQCVFSLSVVSEESEMLDESSVTHENTHAGTVDSMLLVGVVHSL